MKFRKGFTFIEVLIAIGILLIVLVPFASSFLSASKTNAASRDKLLATQLAQKYMEEAKRDGFIPAAVPVEDGGFFIETKVEKAMGTTNTKAQATAPPDMVTSFAYEGSVLKNQDGSTFMTINGGEEIPVSIGSDQVIIASESFSKSAAENAILIQCKSGSPGNALVTFKAKNNTDTDFSILVQGEPSERNQVNLKSEAGTGKGNVNKQIMSIQATPPPVTGFGEEYLYDIKVKVTKNNKEMTVLHGSKKVR